jgi:6-methylsalicylate decarboxylase
MIVDVHAHYYPAEYLDRIGRPGLPPAWAALGRQRIDERLDLLDRAGIDAQVLSVAQAQPYLPDPSAAAEAASLANDLYADLCEAHKGRFFSFAALPLPHVRESLAEIARTAGSRPVVGVTIGCSVAARQLDDPVFDPVFADLDRRGARVFLHPVGHEDLPWLAGHNLAWLVGAPFEDTVAALRLVFAGVPDRYPGIRFIVPHAGGTLPFLQARLARMSPAEITRGLRTMYYDTVCGSAEAMVHACHAFGAERMLFGTDYPYCDEQQFTRHLAYLGKCGLDPGILDQVCGGTAEALLDLSERA